MPYIPIQLPPGVRKNGTLYQAKGRWYDADLIRWQEGAMQPIGGWSRFYRDDAPDLSAAIQYDDSGASYTDLTTAVNNATVSDVLILPAVPAINDIFYVGLGFPFSGITFFLSAVATSGAGTWEYYAGATLGWKALSNVVDNTTDFQTAGSKSVIWDIPTDWETTTINSQGPFYYVRYRVTTAHDAQPVADYADMYSSPVKLLEPIRGALGWKDNSQGAFAALGTATKLYVYGAASLYDVTPSAGFTTGGEDATVSSGNYGDGGYGAGLYGTGDASGSTITEANSWQLDNFGEDLIACAYSDGKLWLWDRTNPSTEIAALNAEAPIENVGVVVTPERFVVGLGGRGQVTGQEDATSDARRVIWSDQENYGEWDPTAAGSQAGTFILPGNGELMCGVRSRNETLLWTTVDLFAMRYIGGTLVYSFQQVGSNCGAISRHAKTVMDGRAIWMGHRGFFVYDGGVSPLPCEVSDAVFNDIDRTQASKVCAFPVSEYREIWFCYPSASGGTGENDKVVVYNYAESYWTGPWDLERTAGFDRGAFSYPVACDHLGQVYNHEVGTEMKDATRVNTLLPSAESGPVELGQGDNVLTIRQIIPDENSLGDVDMTLYAALYPTASESLQTVTTLYEPTSVRITGRQIRLKVVQDQTGWRLGVVRLEAIARGRR